jgi:hypothetical protein
MAVDEGGMNDPLNEEFVKHVEKYRPDLATSRLAAEVRRLRNQGLPHEDPRRTEYVVGLERALTQIADGDAQNWPECSARRVAALALGRKEDDVNRKEPT